MRYKTFQEYREAWNDAKFIDPPIPTSIDIELSSVCNLECPFCFIADKKFDSFIKTKNPDGKPKARLMPKELALKIIYECAAVEVPALKMNWRGESTLHPDYAEILHFAHRMVSRLYDTDGPLIRAFHDILVNTNLNCNSDALQGLMYATKVMVSHDSLDAETYAKMRAGGDIDKVAVNVRTLIAQKHPNLWLRRVITKDNVHEKFFEACRQEYGDTGYRISQHFCFDRNAAEHNQLWDPKEQKYLDAATYGRTYCQYPSQRIVVSSSGICFPCCIDLQETMPIGDINKQPLMEIWNGEPMVNLRKALRRNAILETPEGSKCRSCESWLAYDAPQRAFVGDVEITSSEQEADQIERIMSHA